MRILLFLFPVCLLSAQEVKVPPFRLSAEAADAAARRIDADAMALERTKWNQSMSRTPEAERKALEVPPPADDATFVRRAYLDIQARLPAPQELRAFVADTDPAKRALLVDRLLLEPASSARRFTRLANMLRAKDEVLGVSLKPYVDWLRDACTTAMPYDKLVHTLVTASGDVETNPPTGWLLGEEGHLTVTVAEALRVFLDQDIACARCHNHPYNNWTQMDYYQVAACLGGAQIARTGPEGRKVLWPPESWSDAEQLLAANERLSLQDMRGNEPLRLPMDWAYKDGRAGDPVRPRLPAWRNAEFTTSNILGNVKEEELREFFAKWLVENHRFPIVAALRTWHEFLGSPARQGYKEAMEGFGSGSSRAERIRARSCEAEPHRGAAWSMSAGGLVDDLLDRRNGAIHQRFIERLGLEMTAVRHDVREFERILCRTEVYQRECMVQDLGAPIETLAPVLRPLPPETVWNNFMRIQTDGEPSADRPLSHELPQALAEDHPSRLLGRGGREWGDDSYQSTTHGLVRFMMNGELSQRATAPDSPLIQRLSRMQPRVAAVEEAFLVVLGRLPSQKEKLNAMDNLVAQPATGWEDIVWSLLNTSEFLFQR